MGISTSQTFITHLYLTRTHAGIRGMSRLSEKTWIPGHTNSVYQRHIRYSCTFIRIRETPSDVLCHTPCTALEWYQSIPKINGATYTGYPHQSVVCLSSIVYTFNGSWEGQPMIMAPHDCGQHCPPSFIPLLQLSFSFFLPATNTV